MNHSLNERAVILRRRARFVGAALLAISGCASGAHPAESPEVRLPEASPAEPPPEPPPSRARAEPARHELPPLDVPPEADGVAKTMFEQLAKHVPPIHEAIDRFSATLPEGCDLSRYDCERRWRAEAARIEELAADAVGLRSVCPGSSELAKTHAARVEQHVAHILDRLAELERAIAQSLEKHGSRNVAIWRKLRAGHALSEPMVCLDCANW